MQSLSALAIAGGLIFTAFQFRHLRKSQHVANFAKLVEMQMHLREMRVTDPKLAAVYRHDVMALNSDTEIREYFFNLMQLSVYEIVWFMHRYDQVPTDYFDSWAKRMREIAAEQSFRRMMANPSMKILHDEFQAYIQQMIEKTPARQEPRAAAPDSPAAASPLHASTPVVVVDTAKAG